MMLSEVLKELKSLNESVKQLRKLKAEKEAFLVEFMKEKGLTEEVVEDVKVRLVEVVKKNHMKKKELVSELKQLGHLEQVRPLVEKIENPSEEKVFKLKYV